MITTEMNTTKSSAEIAGSTLQEIDHLARRIDRDGFDRTTTDEIDHMLSIARSADTSPVLAEVLADSAETPAARERAFGLLAMQILSRIDRARVTLAA